MASLHETGGAAFPQQPVWQTPHGAIGYDVDPGMTLRDWFAGQALMSWPITDDARRDAEGLAAKCYRLADAMLAERQKAGA